MTNQEEIQNAIEWIEGLRDGWNDKDNIKYCNMAIKALEQGMVLDKIRAEIAEKKQKINFKGLDDYEKAQVEIRLSTLNEILQIIDKYRMESEEI